MQYKPITTTSATTATKNHKKDSAKMKMFFISVSFCQSTCSVVKFLSSNEQFLFHCLVWKAHSLAFNSYFYLFSFLYTKKESQNHTRITYATSHYYHHHRSLFNFYDIIFTQKRKGEIEKWISRCLFFHPQTFFCCVLHKKFIRL